MIVPLPLFVQLAAACAPGVHVDTLAAVARTESRFQSLAVNDNTSGRSHLPATREAAVALATALLARRHSLDLGLMQINSANLSRLGLSVADTFDPCRSLSSGARVLTGFYRRQPVGSDPQAALLRALSGYNTGNHTRGFANGYVAKVQASAEAIVPAIRTRAGDPPAKVETVGEGERTPPPAPQPPAWDVWAQARAARDRGPAPSAGEGAPVVLQVIGSAGDVR